MFNPDDIGQLLAEQMYDFVTSSGRKLPMIEPEPFDDAEGMGFQPLDRWMDRKFKPLTNRWA